MINLGALWRRPIAWVLSAALACALLVFPDFGQTWDEPLYYKYADALGYAYTPANWVSGHFDLSQAYGPSADDHKTRGPGYLILAGSATRLLRTSGLSVPDSWHLFNSLTFILGAYFVYGLSRRLTGTAAAAVGAALFVTQPLLWGHAFVNPKDIPFMVFFAGAVWSGWRMVDSMISMEVALHRAPLSAVILPAALLGLATSSRVLGPLAGMLVMGYWLSRRPTWRQARWFLLYAMLAAGVMLATWPYLWEDPLNFVRVFGLMAENPTVLPVLFARQIFPANALPLRYLPFYLGATITEPIWPLAALGLFLRPRQEGDQPPRRAVMALLVGWVLTPLAYVLLLRPPMYDGMRHFLFMLPPAFILAAAGLEMLARWLRPRWVRIVLVGAVLVPGMSGIVLLHPYEYTYYNSLVGGTGGAFRQYETDYWLTCYKEAVERLHDADPGPARLFVHREAAVAEPYADSNITIKEERDHKGEIQAGDYILVNSRTNEDLRTDRDASLVLSVQRMGATFCVVKRSS